ncbi:hypothetical protein PARHAE_01055 [Paracoccus haematequi]|uniref:Uncharacterized protein n=1 Tax=Paracoccus haematequi TaxID=2491866 RepID=A0A447IK55_9RHOB|nr:hypothetical protein [Paracoccus haematequi]VDS07876.1 hypothetical protein PARHAE_01055 [Paracoccus haematequi]
MTALLVAALSGLAILAVYIAALSARVSADAGSFSDAGGDLPGWAVMFATAGILLAGIDLPAHLALIGTYGLQASHIGIGLVLAAMGGLLFRGRLWLAARIAGLGSPGEALGLYYGSVALRVVVLSLVVIFALPFAAHLLSGAGGLLETATGGALPRTAAIAVLAFALFLPAVIGGWRASVLVLAVQSALLLALILFTVGFPELIRLPGGFLSVGIAVPEGMAADRIPGVFQYSAGIGKDHLPEGIFTTLGIASASLSLVGLAISPGLLWLAQSARPGREGGFGLVWLGAGLSAGILLLAAPFLAARLSAGPGPYAEILRAAEPLAGLALILLLILAGQMAAGFFATSGTLLVMRELVCRFVLPGLDAKAQRLAARIGLGFAFFALAVLAGFAPLFSALFASLALPLSLQLLPALLGLCFVPWISRGAVLAGLVFGALLVFFTEPPGLILFEALFLDLPWGRWPLTIHSAAWGLAFNLAVVLLASIFSKGGEERAHRERLHRAFAENRRGPAIGRTGATALWSLTLIWAFLAVGPGAILGNWFFTQPVFAGAEILPGLPSLMIWQLLFWLIGVMLVWWLAGRSGLGVTSDAHLRRISLTDPGLAMRGARAPDWIAAGVARVTGRLS